MTATTVGPPVMSAGPWRRFARRLRGNPLGMTSLVVIVLVLLAGSFGSWLTPYGPGDSHFNAVFQPPMTVGHVLGTDDLGRDLLTRMFYGIGASLQVGFIAVGVAFALGIPAGLLAGSSRWADAVLSRINDVVLAFPFLLFAVGVASILGPSLGVAAFAIGISNVPTVMRVMRVETMRVLSLDYAVAATVQGAGRLRVLVSTVLPNSLSALIVQATVIMPTAILGEALLSFLGLGIQPPMPSLGGMLSDAQQYAASAPWAALVPGVCIFLICLSFNTFGDAMRDALDVTTSRATR